MNRVILVREELGQKRGSLKKAGAKEGPSQYANLGQMETLGEEGSISDHFLLLSSNNFPLIQFQGNQRSRNLGGAVQRSQAPRAQSKAKTGGGWTWGPKGK